jgi:hypothetical protein
MRNVAIYGGLCVAAILAFGFGLCIFDHSAKQCVRESVDWLSKTVEMSITLALSIWLGIEAAKLSKRYWLGWVTGLSVFVGAAFILAYAGK